jgi:hypothetical protein
MERYPRKTGSDRAMVECLRAGESKSGEVSS